MLSAQRRICVPLVSILWIFLTQYPHAAGQFAPPKARTTISATRPMYVESAGTWTMPWMMGPVNSAIVKQSNAAVGFAPNLSYTEGMKVPSVWFITSCVMPALAGLTLFVLPPVRELLFSLGVIPRPGQVCSAHTCC